VTSERLALPDGMRAYVGNEGRTVALVADVQARRMGVLITAAGWRNPKRGIPWALDNGAYSAWTQGRPLDLDRFERVLKKVPADHRPDFAVLPDIVAGGLASLVLSIDATRWVPHGWPWYLAVQDGIRTEHLAHHAKRISGVFLGGTIAYKLRTGAAWAEWAHDHGMPLHYARCGTAERIAHAIAIGADSIDSMSWARNDTYHILDQAASEARVQQRLEVTNA
jgi:hypothetical protein